MNNTSQYNQKIIDHFTHPHNVGEVSNADGIGEVGNPMCGDMMKLTIKVGKNLKGKEILEDVKFKTYGCAAAIATSSMVTDMAMGKTLDDAILITREDVATELGGLPEIKMHCSNLAADALRKAIENYRSKGK
jgi:nitrogen fixation protein NifU and related proteins